MKMNKRLTKIILVSSLLGMLLPPNAAACTIKGGKNCTHTAGHKADHKVKTGKTSPAGNVGAFAHSTAPVVTGQAGSHTERYLAFLTHDGYHIISVSSLQSPLMSDLFDLFNPDGTLSQKALSMGFSDASSLVVKPNQQAQVSIATPQQLPKITHGYTGSSTARAHINGPVEVYHPLSGTVYQYEQAIQYGDPSFHLIVVGIKEPER